MGWTSSDDEDGLPEDDDEMPAVDDEVGDVMAMLRASAALASTPQQDRAGEGEEEDDEDDEEDEDGEGGGEAPVPRRWVVFGELTQRVSVFLRGFRRRRRR